MVLTPAACSALLANPATSATMPSAATTPARISNATPIGDPQSAPTMSVVAIKRTVMLTMPTANALSSLPASTETRGMGEESKRAMVPVRRSSNIPVTPACIVKNKKKIAIPAA